LAWGAWGPSGGGPHDPSGEGRMRRPLAVEGSLAMAVVGFPSFLSSLWLDVVPPLLLPHQWAQIRRGTSFLVADPSSRSSLMEDRTSMSPPVADLVGRTLSMADPATTSPPTVDPVRTSLVRAPWQCASDRRLHGPCKRRWI
jgi:hypothetical protein